uniref:glutathione transferase n=1 Tax=Angiostrongylus cantonensis TaxID=6313 RepID=A0A0K0D7I6_ANGCA
LTGFSGLAGKDAFEEAVINSLGDLYTDYRTEVKPYFYVLLGLAPGDLDKLEEETMVPARDNRYPFLFLNECMSIHNLTFNTTITGFLVGNSLSWVDVLIAEHLSEVIKRVPGFLDGFPEVSGYFSTCLANVSGKLILHRVFSPFLRLCMFKAIF